MQLRRMSNEFAYLLFRLINSIHVLRSALARLSLSLLGGLFIALPATPHLLRTLESFGQNGAVN
jgi:hypothetical protein